MKGGRCLRRSVNLVSQGATIAPMVVLPRREQPIGHVTPRSPALLPSLQAKMSKRVLALFDVDGTLTVPRNVSL